jgi:hypothetical protein
MESHERSNAGFSEHISILQRSILRGKIQAPDEYVLVCAAKKGLEEDETMERNNSNTKYPASSGYLAGAKQHTLVDR